MPKRPGVKFNSEEYHKIFDFFSVDEHKALHNWEKASILMRLTSFTVEQRSFVQKYSATYKYYRDLAHNDRDVKFWRAMDSLKVAWLAEVGPHNWWHWRGAKRSFYTTHLMEVLIRKWDRRSGSVRGIRKWQHSVKRATPPNTPIQSRPMSPMAALWDPEDEDPSDGDAEMADELGEKLCRFFELREQAI
ncbi:hypothetical protein MPER_11989 [Moniliophthora perniciosa FA553]|nr:hypothetical protein MPER_11989 [Moniliophthora perniciosa FA553]